MRNGHTIVTREVKSVDGSRLFISSCCSPSALRVDRHEPFGYKERELPPNV